MLRISPAVHTAYLLLILSARNRPSVRTDVSRSHLLWGHQHLQKTHKSCLYVTPLLPKGVSHNSEIHSILKPLREYTQLKWSWHRGLVLIVNGIIQWRCNDQFHPLIWKWLNLRKTQSLGRTKWGLEASCPTSALSPLPGILLSPVCHLAVRMFLEWLLYSKSYDGEWVYQERTRYNQVPVLKDQLSS